MRNIPSIFKEEIRGYWNHRSESYSGEFGHGFFSSQEYNLWIELLRRHIPPAQNDSRALDLGTGPGFMAMLLYEIGYGVDGVDIAENMITIARESASQKSFSINYHCGDVENLQFTEELFDVVICRHLMWTLADPERAIQNWKILLKPRGMMVIIDGVWVPNTPEACLRRFIAKVIRAVQERKIPANWQKSYVSNPKNLSFMDGMYPSEVIRILRSNQFEDIKSDDLKAVVQYEKKNAPLTYRIQHSNAPRYLITVVRP